MDLSQSTWQEFAACVTELGMMTTANDLGGEDQEVSPPLPPTTFTSAFGDTSSYLQRQISNRDVSQEEKEGNIASLDDGEDVDALVEQVLLYKQLQESRQSERNLVQYIKTQYFKLQEVQKDKEELLDGVKSLVEQSAQLRAKVDSLTSENKRYKKTISHLQRKNERTTVELEETKKLLRESKEECRGLEQKIGVSEVDKVTVDNQVKKSEIDGDVAKDQSVVMETGILPPYLIEVEEEPVEKSGLLPLCIDLPSGFHEHESLNTSEGSLDNSNLFDSIQTSSDSVPMFSVDPSPFDRKNKSIVEARRKHELISPNVSDEEGRNIFASKWKQMDSPVAVASKRILDVHKSANSRDKIPFFHGSRSVSSDRSSPSLPAPNQSESTDGLAKPCHFVSKADYMNLLKVIKSADASSAEDSIKAKFEATRGPHNLPTDLQTKERIAGALKSERKRRSMVEKRDRKNGGKAKETKASSASRTSWPGIEMEQDTAGAAAPISSLQQAVLKKVIFPSA